MQVAAAAIALGAVTTYTSQQLLSMHRGGMHAPVLWSAPKMAAVAETLDTIGPQNCTTGHACHSSGRCPMPIHTQNF